ncbi:MAG: energy-coupling factor transporter transmembrane protein EcfT [Candidatus Caldarchaeum sp.]|nr:energy-coupling factor transporter transmembrane protein EcfT [Candidatus Caldarchaeum sp.]MDW7978008.1 energy-coupling factor transporter transmembrane component T [Candidatus Caldarchaeum sp.]MDW8359130.1 energy-coupling factor transporter transmembrane component T [Candidatus Caldarchaeum sp.]
MAFVISDILKGLILYTPRNSFFNKVHPAVKLYIVIIFSVAALLTPTHSLALVNLALIIIVVAIARVPVKALRLYTFVIGWMLFVSFIFYSFFTPVRSGPVLLTIGPLVVGLHNLMAWLLVALKFLAVSYVTALLLVTTKHRDLAIGLRSWGMPYVVSFTLAAILRNLAVVSVDLFTIIDAQSSRGLNFRKGNPIARLAKFVRVGIPLIYVSLKRTEEMSNAMASRGFKPRGKKTSYYVIPMRARDYFVLGLFTLHFVLMLAASVGLLDVSGFRLPFF